MKFESALIFETTSRILPTFIYFCTLSVITYFFILFFFNPSKKREALALVGHVNGLTLVNYKKLPFSIARAYYEQVK